MNANVIVPLFGDRHFLPPHGHGRLGGTFTRITSHEIATLHTALLEQALEDIRHGFQLRSGFYAPAVRIGDHLRHAEDVVQESLLALLEEPQAIAEERRLLWLIRTARRQLRNVCRRRAPNPLDTRPLSLSEDWARLDDDDDD